MGQCQGRLVKSRRVQLIPRPQKMAINLQRQGRSARLVERRIHCTDELLAGWKFANAHSSRPCFPLHLAKLLPPWTREHGLESRIHCPLTAIHVSPATRTLVLLPRFFVLVPASSKPSPRSRTGLASGCIIVYCRLPTLDHPAMGTGRVGHEKIQTGKTTHPSVLLVTRHDTKKESKGLFYRRRRARRDMPRLTRVGPHRGTGTPDPSTARGGRPSGLRSRLHESSRAEAGREHAQPSLPPALTGKEIHRDCTRAARSLHHQIAGPRSAGP